MIRTVPNRTQEEIAREWDRIADLRFRQIEEGKDISFHHILLPCLLDLCAEVNLSHVIDVGCGVGFTSRELAKRAREVVGVDLSPLSIEVARREMEGNGKLSFVNASIENYSLSQAPGSFTLAVANMMLGTALSLHTLFQAIGLLLKPGGHFVFTIAHPWFWPLYWGYAAEHWFEYDKEILIEAPFRISLRGNEAPVTTHIHRPLQDYFNALLFAGFSFERLIEPTPSREVAKMYPEPWKYPRFLAIRCVSTGESLA